MVSSDFTRFPDTFGYFLTLWDSRGTSKAPQRHPKDPQGTQKAPQSWTVKFGKKIDELSRASPNPTKILKLKKKGKDLSLKKVSGLINYFKTSTLVEDEKTRGILLGELENARDLWRKKSWEEIVAR